MTSRIAVDTLRVLLTGTLLATIFLQLIGLPWLSVVMAQDFPGEAHMRWPVLALSILGLGCVQAGIVCVIRLLGFAGSEVFSPEALRWVDGIIANFTGGARFNDANFTGDARFDKATFNEHAQRIGEVFDPTWRPWSVGGSKQV